MADALKKDIPEISYTAPAFGPATYGTLSNLLAASDKKISPDGLIAGEEFLEIFKYPLLQGNANLAIKDPSSIVLTQSTAKALFGDIDPMNKIVSTRTALAALKPIFNKYNPHYPFEYHFVDENYAAKFELEMLIGKLAGIFAALAVFIISAILAILITVATISFQAITAALMNPVRSLKTE